jgi:hypothetical protein
LELSREVSNRWLEVAIGGGRATPGFRDSGLDDVRAHRARLSVRIPVGLGQSLAQQLAQRLGEGVVHPALLSAGGVREAHTAR